MKSYRICRTLREFLARCDEIGVVATGAPAPGDSVWSADHLGAIYDPPDDEDAEALDIPGHVVPLSTRDEIALRFAVAYVQGHFAVREPLIVERHPAQIAILGYEYADAFFAERERQRGAKP